MGGQRGQTWPRCGHPKTDENTHDCGCRRCHYQRNYNHYHSDAGQLAYRKRILPKQIATAAAKLERLKQEAQLLGLEVRL